MKEKTNLVELKYMEGAIGKTISKTLYSRTKDTLYILFTDNTYFNIHAWGDGEDSYIASGDYGTLQVFSDYSCKILYELGEIPEHEYLRQKEIFEKKKRKEQKKRDIKTIQTIFDRYL